MTTTAIACPYCGRENDSHTSADPRDRPAPGDVSICWGCRQIGLFTDTGVRKPTAAEPAELEQAPEVRQALAAMREAYTPSEANQLRKGGGAG